MAALLAYVLARELIGNDTWAFATGLAMAFLPNPLFYVAEVMSENFAVVLLLCSSPVPSDLAQATERGLALPAAMGVVIGVLSLTKPVAQVLILVVPVFVALSLKGRRAWQGAVVVFAAFALVLAPWLVRNTIVLGMPQLTTNQGDNLLIAYNSDPVGSNDARALDPSFRFERRPMRSRPIGSTAHAHLRSCAQIPQRCSP